MVTPVLRIGIVGASSLLGKELNEELGRSALAVAETVLLDDAEAEGRLQAAGDELTFVRKLDAGSLEGLDLVFFAGTRAQTLRHWEAARGAGATVIDLTRTLGEVPGATVWAPGLVGEPDLGTTVEVPAYGAAMPLALVGERLRAAGMVARLFAATVLLPASEFGRAAMDELQQQTVSLLSFQAVPQEVFGGQLAFNTVAEFGAGAAASVAEEGRVIMGQYRRLSAGRLPELLLQAVAVPVFHGCTISLMVELEDRASAEAVRRAVRGPGVKAGGAADAGGDAGTAEQERGAPSNLAAAGQGEVLLQVSGEGEGDAAAGVGTRFAIWMAADTLRMATAAATECALHMRRLRPHGTVQ